MLHKESDLIKLQFFPTAKRKKKQKLNVYVHVELWPMGHTQDVYRLKTRAD